ncbi:DUF2283 domain-containing protein [Microbacterium paraoxydans]|uniref:DUF2283 domain-containing protein n=1 Tax=Microbacterium paraoxydans TaxID=199592 RepID=UPI003D71B148
MSTFSYDGEADAAYLGFGTIEAGESTRQVPMALPDGVRGEVILDFDADGHLLGVEILQASALLRPRDLERGQ